MRTKIQEKAAEKGKILSDGETDAEVVKKLLRNKDVVNDREGMESIAKASPRLAKDIKEVLSRDKEAFKGTELEADFADAGVSEVENSVFTEYHRNTINENNKTDDSVKSKEITIENWDDYPDKNIPKGPFRVLHGDEYKEARKIANKVNKDIHRKNLELRDMHIHEIIPVKFGGSPTDLSNKIILTPEEHKKYTAFWNKVLARERSKDK